MTGATICQEVSPLTKGMIPPMTQGLIVDFPCEPRIALNAQRSKGTVSTASTFPRPQVQISQFSQLFMIPYDDTESKWYTQEEMSRFKESRLSDIHTLRDLLRDATPALISEETLCECVGMENFLSSFTAHLVIQKRRAHSEAILSMQRNYQGDHKIEMLAKTSQKSSRWARKRAANMALGFAKGGRY
jgi:hypothetical protein